jgi:hypothetical protein
MRDDEEDRLPWLEAVEEEAPESAGPSLGKTIGLVIVGLAVLGAAVGGYSWWSGRGATEGHGELIAAPAGPYKVKPDEPGGMAVEGEGDTAFAASEGAEPQGKIDMGAVPEEPVTQGAPKAAAPGAEGSIQLGAFSSEAGAEAAWKALSGRFAYLEPLGHSVVPVASGDKTLYRLRASGPGAAGICGRLRVAGETCISVD